MWYTAVRKRRSESDHDEKARGRVKMKTRILTVGSSSMITSVRSGAIPAVGRSTIAEKYSMRPGGHGTLAAIAVSKLGGDSVFCSSVGEDGYANAIREFCKGYGVDTRFVGGKSGVRTGIAVAFEGDSLPRTCVEVPGANLRLRGDDAEDAFTCLPDAALIRSRGIPAQTVLDAMNEAKRRDIPIVLDLVGVDKTLPLDKLSADIVVLDQHTAEAYTGIFPAGEQTCMRAVGFIERQIRTKYTIILLDEMRGIFLSDNKFHEMIAPYETETVSAEAAEDAYIGALTLDYVRGLQGIGRDIYHACAFAGLAKAWTLATRGSAMSLPTDADMRSFVEANGIRFSFYD